MATDRSNANRRPEGVGGVSGGDHAARRPGAFRRFLGYYRSQMHIFWGDMVCALLVAAIDLAFPQILRTLNNDLFTRPGDEILGALAILLVGFAAMYALRYFCRYFVGAWGHIMGTRMETAMRQDLFDKYEVFSFSWYDRVKTGDLVSRVVNDLFDISEAAHHGPENIIISGIELIGMLVIMMLINWRLAVPLAVVAALAIAYLVARNRTLQAAFHDNRVKISGVNSQLEDSLQGMRVVKSFVAEKYERERFARSNEAFLDSKVRTYRNMGRFWAVSSTISGLLYTVLVVWGGYLVAQGQLPAVDLAIFALYIGILATPIETLINFTEIFQKAAAGFKRFCEILDTVPDIQDKPGAPDLVVRGGSIDFDDVVFRYEGAADAVGAGDAVGAAGAAGSAGFAGAVGAAGVAGAGGSGGATVGSRPLAIDHLNLHVDGGTTVALVGPSGGGKTTTCSLLPRFYDVAGGSVRVDGTDVRDVTVASLRGAIGLVPQDVYLFDGTIGENIAYGRLGATREEIREAARRANIDEFVESLPMGYDTPVGEHGARLSGGQKQRVAIARVFLKNPPIIVLDEATSALDNESERAVQASLAELAKGRTVLVIAHRLSTIRSADRIVVIQDGKAVEQGSHEELLAADGVYARYYRLQFDVGC